MSRENVKKFYELAEKDVDLAQKLASLDNEMSLEASDLANLKAIVNEKIIPLAKEKGLDFTAEEMVDFANDKYIQLSEDDLLEVSGGVSPKAAGLALSSVLMLSLGSAAAINLMNNNHDDVSHVVSEPSKTASEEKDESEDEEALKKSLDEMMKKSPKGADKNATMEDIEKELDKLFKGGKLGGGSAFRPGKGRTAGKNMLNRTIGKKGTSDFDFDKFLKELDGEIARESATSQAAKPKATISETSNFDFDKFMEEINSDRKSEPGATRAAASNTTPLEEEAKPAPTTTSARIEETSKPVPISKGTTKGDEKKKENKKENKKSTKISKKKNNEQQYKEMAQQQVNKRLSEFKAKFENSFKEKFKTQCDAEDLTSFVKEYLATPSNLDGGLRGEETVEFYYGFAGGSARVKVNVLDFAKDLNDALPKMQYEPVGRHASWKDVMSHVMGALQEAKYDLNKFDLDAMKKLQTDIDWICGSVNKEGYLQAKFSANYGADANSIERKNIEYLKALKDSLYNQNDEKVQSALKALSENIHEEPVKKPDASGVGQERTESEKKAEEERLMKEKEEQKRIAHEKKDEMARSMGGVDEEDDFINTGRIDISDAQSTETAENYKPVRKSDSWKNIMAHVMEALNKVGFDINKLNSAEQINLKNDINWICSEMKQANGTYYLGASALLGGAVRSNYGWNTKNPSHENKELEFLQTLKTANYNVAAEKVQSALKELSSDELNDENKEQNISSGTEDKKVHLFESQETAQKIVDDLADTFKQTVEETFNSKTQLSEAELQKFVDGITSALKSDPAMQKVAIVGSNSVTFFAKGQLKDGTEVESSNTVNVLELAKELNVKLPKAGVEDTTKDETEKPQKELIVSDISKPDAGGVSLSKDEATKLVSEYSGFLPADFTAGQQAVTLVNFLKKLGNVENLKLVDKKYRELLAQNIKHIYDQSKTDKSGKPYLQNFYNWSISADDLNLVGQAFEIVKDDFAQEENKDKLAKPQEELKEKPVVKSDAGATVTTAKDLQGQANTQKKEAEIELTDTFKAKIAANNGIELNEANLNKMISETLNSYKGQENITVNEKNGTITFTAKGITKGLILTGADSRSATLNVREFFAKLNNEATEERRTSGREKFDHTKYITATEADVTGGLKLARETAKKMIREEFNKIIVEKYNAENSAKKATSVEDIPAGKMVAIVNSLKIDEVVASIVKANLNKVDDFKIKDAKKLNGQFSIKTAVANEEIKIGAIGYKGLTGIIGFRSPDLIKYGDEISIREEAEKLIKESVETYTVSYKTVIGGRASAEAEALFKFLADNNLIKDGKIVDNVIDAIKDSDKEQFKKDVKHIAGQISGGEGSYSLSGKIFSYSVDQNKLKAIKDLATQLGV